MLPAAHVKRVRVHSVSAQKDCELRILQSGDLDPNERAKEDNDQTEFKKTFAQACSEATYKAVLDPNAFKETVRHKPSLIVLRFSQSERWMFRLSLKVLRRILMTINLVAFVSMIFSYAAWSTVSTARQANKGVEPHPWIHSEMDPLLAISLPYMDRTLFTISNYLLLYYLIFGFIFTLFYGGQTNLLCIVLMAPVILVMALVLIAVAGVTLYFRKVLLENLEELSMHETRQHLTYHLQKSLMDLHEILDTWGIPFAVFLILTSVSKIALATLPWFLYDLPFQRMMDIEDMVIYDIEKRKVNLYPRSLKNADRSSDSEIVAESCRPDDGRSSRINRKTRRPYRMMSSATTVLLQLCKPELRAMHRT